VYVHLDLCLPYDCIVGLNISRYATGVRMVLNEAGIAKGWIIEQMPEGRIMVDMILTPDGKVSLAFYPSLDIGSLNFVPNLMTGHSH
jgi:hypothetical protein